MSRLGSRATIKSYSGDSPSAERDVPPAIPTVLESMYEGDCDVIDDCDD